jgi:hypothetical protein
MMAETSLLRIGSLLSVALLMTTATPAFASKWMIIGAEPEPSPNRSIYLVTADDSWISRRFADGFDVGSPNALASLQANTIRIISVYQVFEKAGGTNFISYTLEFKCQEGLVSIPQATSYDRAGKQENGGSPDWMRVPDNWMGKAEMIACGWESWRSAKQIWREGDAPSAKRKKSKAKEPTVSFASLGMEYLGEANYFTPTELVDLVWNKRWTDAVQPPYYDGTPAEKAAAAAKLAEMQAKISTTLQEAKTNVEDEIRMQEKIDKKLGRLGDKFYREMQGIGGKSEENVISLFGIPQGLVETTPGVRQLNYYWSDTEEVAVPYTVDIMGSTGNGGQGKIGETSQVRYETRTIQCYRKLFLREGGQLPGYRVFDFDIKCS